MKFNAYNIMLQVVSMATIERVHLTENYLIYKHVFNIPV